MAVGYDVSRKQARHCREIILVDEDNAVGLLQNLVEEWVEAAIVLCLDREARRNKEVTLLTSILSGTEETKRATGD